MPENALERLKSFARDILQSKTKLIRLLLIVMILLLAVVMRIHEDSKADITVESSDAASTQNIVVDLGGAVVSPGVYTVEPGTRLFEVVEMAGGLTSDADTDSINRAEFVEDGEKIIIPVKPPSPADYYDPDSDKQPEDGGASVDNQSSLSSSAASTAESPLININYAGKEELMTLSGIGEAKADSIIEYRSSRKFRKKEDIKSVKGIGDAIYSRIKDYITV